MLESDYSKRLLKSIRMNKIHCYKTADRFRAGVPDIYVIGGNWVESKVVPFKNMTNIRGRAGYASIYTKLSADQERFCQNFSRGGDGVSILVMFVDMDTGHLTSYSIVPFQFLEEHKSWSPQMRKAFSLGRVVQMPQGYFTTDPSKRYRGPLYECFFQDDVERIIHDFDRLRRSDQ